MKSDDQRPDNAASFLPQSHGTAGGVAADAEYATSLLDAAEAIGARAGVSGAATMTTDQSLSGNTSNVVVLPEQCVMREALELKAQLLKCLGTPDAVQIDAAKVERIDAAGVQVILAFVLDRAKQERNVEWCSVNQTMREAAQAMGLESALRLPTEVAA